MGYYPTIELHQLAVLLRESTLAEEPHHCGHRNLVDVISTAKPQPALDSEITLNAAVPKFPLQTLFD